MGKILPLLLILALAGGGCKLKKDEDPDGGAADSGRDVALSDSDGPTADSPGGDVGDGPAKETSVTVDKGGDLMPHFEWQLWDLPPPKDGPVVTKDTTVIQKDVSTTPTTASICASGGTLISADGKAVLIVWAKALTSCVSFSVKSSLNTWGNVGLAYDFSPTTTTFAKKAKIIISYNPALLKGASESNLKLGIISSGVWQTVPGSTVDTTGNQVSGEVSALGVFGVLCPGCKLDAGIPDGSNTDAKVTDGVKEGSVGDSAPPLPDIYSTCKHPAVSKSCTSGWCQIPGGCFVMGSPKFEKCRNPDETLHAVKLTKKFEIMDTSVTQSQYQNLMGYNPSSHTTCGSDCPVEMVSWHEAAAYCNILSQKKGLTQCYGCAGSKKYVSCSSKYTGSNIYQCPGYRLPTEAEWEYAYRAGTTTPFYNGQITSCTTKDPNADAIGWYTANSGGKLHPVKKKLPNKWGLYDLGGNVYDWTNDWYLKDLGTTAASDPAGPSTGLTPVFRGGSWYCYPRTLRGARRSSYTPTLRYNYLGFRCVRSN